MADVTLTNLHKRFDRTEAVSGIDLEIKNNEFVVLVGPSGCGKSTTLRMIAGLEEVTEGEILIGGELVNDVPPKDRDIAMVFQNYALYPHMTVFQNMSFGLRLRKYPKDDIKKRVEDAAEVLGITELLNRRPKQLSGGQRQRVAMGRAIVRNPRVFLFDEPLSNLDAKLRGQMRIEIKRVHQHLKTTTVYVTHDQVEAMTLADRVVVMNAGLIDQVGTPGELYHSLNCELSELDGGLVVKVGSELSLPVPSGRLDRYRPHVGKPLTLGIRPEHVTEERVDRDGVSISVDVDFVEPLGMETMVYFSLAGEALCGRVAPELNPQPGQSTKVCFDTEQIHIFDRSTDLAL